MMRRKGYLWRLLALLLIAALVIPLVSNTAVTAQQSPAIIRLGLLSAANSPAGQGAQLAIAEINSTGGITGPDGTVYAIELLSTPATTPAEVRAGLAALRERSVAAILGPDSNDAAQQTLNDLIALGLPVFTAATTDALTITDTSDYVFRARAPEQTYMQAIVAYLVNMFGQPTVAVVQGDAPGSVESIASFTSALRSHNLSPLATLQLTGADALQATIQQVLSMNPAVLAVWAEEVTAASLLQGLRAGGWAGIFFFRDADSKEFRPLLAPNIAVGVLGVTNWTPGVGSTGSDAFLRTYVVTFGDVPDGLSAAYYDAVYMLASAISGAGSDPRAIQQALQLLSEQTGVQGPLNPGQFRIGETTASAAIVELNSYGVPQVRMRFLSGQLVPNDTGGQPSLEATPTAQPGAPTATPTPQATATPEGVYGIVNTFRLNVRTGPGTNYDVLGQLQVDDTVFPIGANQNLTWMVIPFRGTQGWVTAELLDLQGNLNALPIIQPPPSPTPAATATLTPLPLTATPTLQQNADLVVTTASVNPASPISGQPFTTTVTVINNGSLPSPETALAASFLPGEVYTSAVIPPLNPGQSVQVTLTATVNGTGAVRVALVTDLNNLVNEGSNGEANNIYEVPYTVDRALISSGSAALPPGGSSDLVGGTSSNDIAWDGANLTTVNTATIAVLPNLNWNTLTFDSLSGITGTSIPRASLPPGTVVGVITTPEGRRGAIRIDGYNGDTLNYTYRIYGP